MLKKRPLVDCDKCGGRFKLRPQIEKVKSDIEKVHFECKHCKYDYTAYYTNQYIKEKQKEMRVHNFNQLDEKKKLEREIQDEMDKKKKEYDIIKQKRKNKYK